MSQAIICKLIEQKRDGKSLSDDDISFFVNHLSESRNSNMQTELVEPCQIGAMLMAMYMKGLDDKETSTLTRCMKESGYVFKWPLEWRHLVVDKHSTGGVGDKISLVLAPALAALGLKIPMISGRSLAHTGGTLDKLESIPGFRVELDPEEISGALDLVGCCIVGQAARIVPADKILYRSRDLTGTIMNQSLIIASIVSKKLAEGTSALVYDVKFGKGSLFSSEKVALEMAKALVKASSSETKCSAFLTRMDSPIGNAIGNTLEVLESVNCLRGRGPEDLVELVESLGGELLLHTKRAHDLADAKRKISIVLNNGKALKKFYAMIVYQGVAKDTAECLCYGQSEKALPIAKNRTNIQYDGPHGYIHDIDAKVLATIWRDEMNCAAEPCLAAGFILEKHVGDEIRPGDIWLHVEHDTDSIGSTKIQQLKKALTVGEMMGPTRQRVCKKVIFEDGIKIIKY